MHSDPFLCHPHSTFNLNHTCLHRNWCMRVCVCGCMCACICPFAWCITSCVSLTGPVPRWPPCHATLLPLRPTGSDTCEMLTWSVAAPSRASGCCSFSRPLPSLPGAFFFIFQKGLKRLLSPFILPSIPYHFSPLLSSPKMIKEIAAHFPGQ